MGAVLLPLRQLYALSLLDEEELSKSRLDSLERSEAFVFPTGSGPGPADVSEVQESSEVGPMEVSEVSEVQDVSEVGSGPGPSDVSEVQEVQDVSEVGSGPGPGPGPSDVSEVQDVSEVGSSVFSSLSKADFF